MVLYQRSGSVRPVQLNALLCSAASGISVNPFLPLLSLSPSLSLPHSLTPSPPLTDSLSSLQSLSISLESPTRFLSCPVLSPSLSLSLSLFLSLPLTPWPLLSLSSGERGYNRSRSRTLLLIIEIKKLYTCVHTHLSTCMYSVYS